MAEFTIEKYLLDPDDEDIQVTVLWDNEFNQKVMEGDYYHDNIDDKIEGFIQGMYYAGWSMDIDIEEKNWWDEDERD